MKTIEQELEDYIIENHVRIGRPPKGDPWDYDLVEIPADVASSEGADPDPVDHPSRNAALILDYYGMGSLICPTLQELADAYDGMESRERARQIVQRRYRDIAPEEPLPAAAAVAEALERRGFWVESDLIETLRDKGLTDGIAAMKGVLEYLGTQGLAQSFVLCTPKLGSAGAKSYREDADRVLVHVDLIPRLKKTFDRALKIPKKNGLCRLAHVEQGRPQGDLDAVRSLIVINRNAWMLARAGQLWYTFEDRENRLVNECERLFSLIDTCEIDSLASLLENALRARTSAVGEYPDGDVIGEWISRSRYFNVVGGAVSFPGATTGLTDIQNDLVDIMRGRSDLPWTEIRDALAARGHGLPNIEKQVNTSVLVYVDRSGGRGNHRFTLVTDLPGTNAAGQDTSDYQAFKARLAAIESTDTPTETKARREQGILTEWIFRGETACHCAICGRLFDKSSIITAHKKPRRKDVCTEAERRDPHIVFPLCTFGCDHLYEKGVIGVRGGVVVLERDAPGASESAIAEGLAGKVLDPRWTAGHEDYFDIRWRTGGAKMAEAT